MNFIDIFILYPKARAAAVTPEPQDNVSFSTPLSKVLIIKLEFLSLTKFTLMPFFLYFLLFLIDLQ